MAWYSCQVGNELGVSYCIANLFDYLGAKNQRILAHARSLAYCLQIALSVPRLLKELARLSI